MSCIGDILSLNPCGGCLELWIGATVTAGAEIVLSACAIVIYALSLATVSMYKTEDAYRNSGISTFLQIWNMDNDRLSVEDIGSKLLRIFGVALSLAVINMGAACILLYAVIKRNIKGVKGWIVYKALGISLCIIYVLTTIFLGQITLISFFLDLAEVLLLFYFLWVVYAFMKELDAKQVLKMSPSIIDTQGKIEDVNFPL